jgi:hypothetical protein
MLPADLRDFRDYPKVELFVKNHLSMQYDDLRSIMRISGCNFTAAAVLCNIVSGLSVSLYKPARTKKLAKVKGVDTWVKLGTGDLFKMVLESFFPWKASENGREKAKVIYDLIRNPLAHALGVDKEVGYEITIKKSKPRKKGKKARGWTDSELKAIEKSEVHPKGLPLALDGSGKTWSLSVEAFYWGVFQLLRRLAKDKGQMQDAEQRFSTNKVIWHKN